MNGETRRRRSQAVVTEFDRITAGKARGAARGRLTTTRHEVVELAGRLLPEFRWAAITAWPHDTAPLTLAATGDLPRLLDALHMATGDGPCADLARDSSGAPVEIPDLTADDRWPAFAAEAVRTTPVRAMLAYRLPGPCDWCTLTLYSDRADSFDADTVLAGRLFATHACLALDRAREADESTASDEAIHPHGEVRAAVRRIRHTHTVSADVALAILQRASDELQRPLTDVAREVAETGKLPTP